MIVGTEVEFLGKDYLTHHGVLGMKWGVRRYQNADGSLKPKGVTRREAAAQKYERKADSLQKRIETAKTAKKLSPKTKRQNSRVVTRLERKQSQALINAKRSRRGKLTTAGKTKIALATATGVAVVAGLLVADHIANKKISNLPLSSGLYKSGLGGGLYGQADEVLRKGTTFTRRSNVLEKTMKGIRTYTDQVSAGQETSTRYGNIRVSQLAGSEIRLAGEKSQTRIMRNLAEKKPTDFMPKGTRYSPSARRSFKKLPVDARVGAIKANGISNTWNDSRSKKILDALKAEGYSGMRDPLHPDWKTSTIIFDKDKLRYTKSESVS